MRLMFVLWFLIDMRQLRRGGAAGIVNKWMIDLVAN